MQTKSLIAACICLAITACTQQGTGQGPPVQAWLKQAELRRKLSPPVVDTLPSTEDSLWLGWFMADQFDSILARPPGLVPDQSFRRHLYLIASMELGRGNPDSLLVVAFGKAIVGLVVLPKGFDINSTSARALEKGLYGTRSGFDDYDRYALYRYMRRYYTLRRDFLQDRYPGDTIAFANPLIMHDLLYALALEVSTHPNMDTFGKQVMDNFINVNDSLVKAYPHNQWLRFVRREYTGIKKRFERDSVESFTWLPPLALDQ
jgi:hypothetical protein